MTSAPRFPHSYRNTALEGALSALHATPSQERMDALLAAATTGGLVVDITGSTKDSGPQARTLVSEDGHGVLPLFTSMKALEAAVESSAPGTMVQATILPARQALALVGAGDIDAVQFNPGPNALVVARVHVTAALGAHPA